MTRVVPEPHRAGRQPQNPRPQRSPRRWSGGEPMRGWIGASCWRRCEGPGPWGAAESVLGNVGPGRGKRSSPSASYSCRALASGAGSPWPRVVPRTSVWARVEKHRVLEAAKRGERLRARQMERGSPLGLAPLQDSHDQGEDDKQGGPRRDKKDLLTSRHGRGHTPWSPKEQRVGVACPCQPQGEVARRIAISYSKTFKARPSSLPGGTGRRHQNNAFPGAPLDRDGAHRSRAGYVRRAGVVVQA